MRTCLSKNILRPAIPRRKLIMHAKKQNYSFAIDLAHISVAKYGWLCVAPTRNEVRYAP